MENDRENEGEGNKTAARRYNEKTEKFTETTDIEQQAEKARKALDGEEGDDLRLAEEKAAKGEIDKDTVVPNDQSPPKR